jgi:hypothetical protein
MSQSINLAGRFALDEEKAREWLDGITAIYDTDELPESSDDPEFGPDWNPVWPCGEEGSVYQLVYAASNNGVIVKPEGMDLDFVYVDDEDGGYYFFTVDVGENVFTGIRLASWSTEFRKLVHEDEKGTEAAVSILREAVTRANAEVGKLAAFVAAAR